jgi:DnaJ-class molecular chaperone
VHRVKAQILARTIPTKLQTQQTMKKTAIIATFAVLAATGIAAALSVKCSLCNGTGWRGQFRCNYCGGDGDIGK